MIARRPIRWLLRAFLLVGLGHLGATGVALAAEASTAAGVLQLRVHPGPGLPDALLLQRSMEQELGVAVQLDGSAGPRDPVLTIRPTDGTAAAVEFLGLDGRRTGRTVRLPADARRAADTLALLAANLVRNEAADLLATLRPAPPVPDAGEPGSAPTLTPTLTPPASPPPAVPAPTATTPTGATPTAGTAPPQLDDAAVPTVHASTLPRSAVVVAVDVLPGLGWSSPPARARVRHLSLGVLGTWSPVLDGLEGAALVTIHTERVRGLQLAGAANLTVGPVEGVQAAGFVNFATGAVRGVQLGPLNHAGELVSGVQLGTANLVSGVVRGVQGGVGNLVVGDLRGVQAGVGNLALGAVNGIQGGVGNLVLGGLHGIQAGVANYAGRDVRGVQLGVVNLAQGKVSGLQIGVLNLADDADAGIGLLSLYRRGRTHLQAWTQENGLVMAGVQHGSRWIHNVIAIGGLEERGRSRLIGAFGLGARLRLSRRWHLDVDGLEHVLLDPDRMAMAGPDLLSQARVLLGVRVVGPIGLFAGPNYNVLTTHAMQPGMYAGGLDAAPRGGHMLYQSTADDVRVLAWPGVTVGVSGF